MPTDNWWLRASEQPPTSTRDENQSRSSHSEQRGHRNDELRAQQAADVYAPTLSTHEARCDGTITVQGASGGLGG